MTVFTKPSDLPLLIGVAGGSGSGKTYFTNALALKLGPRFCSVVYQDNFYIDQSLNFDFDGGKINFDHPDSIDFNLLASSLVCLSEGREIDIPVYDFVSHKRIKTQLNVQPKPVVIVDGILIFHSSKVRELFHQRLYFDTPEKTRFERRLERDVNERGRTPEGVRSQFLNQVKPMHDQYVEPSKKHAHKIVSTDVDFELALNSIYQKILG